MLYWKTANTSGPTTSEPVRAVEPLDYTPERLGVKPIVRNGRMAMRMYESAKVNRFTTDWTALGTSADSEILTSLRLLRARSRQMVRDNPYALNGVRQIVTNVIGSGIGMQAQIQDRQGNLLKPMNDRLEAEWSEWCCAKTAHTGGILHFHDIERLAMWQIVESGEAIIRKIPAPFGGGDIPFSLEVIESDRLMDQWQTARAPNGNAIRMGVEVDQWGRPVAYWFWPNHPGDYQFQSFQPSKFLRVEASEIIHLYVVNRWPQTRGVPWYHAALNRLRHADRYEDSELLAARASANQLGFITTPDVSAPGEGGGFDEDGNPIDNQRILDTEPLQIQTLLPGEGFVPFNPTRPNSALEGFLRYMLRSVAVGLGPSYSTFAGDYSQHNYSSLRMEALQDRDYYRTIQTWVVRNLRGEIHKDWCDAAALAGKIPAPDYFSDSKRYQKVRFKPRGWTWIDVREIPAMIKSVRAGFTTVTDVISETAGGADAEDVFTTRRRELDLMQSLGLAFDTDPAFVDDLGQEQPDDKEPDGDADDKPTNTPSNKD